MSDRVDKILRAFVRGSGTTPKGFLSRPGNDRYMRALVNALGALPDTAYRRVEGSVSFVFADPGRGLAACAATGPATIVVFEHGLSLPEDRLQEIILHELAHVLGAVSEDEADRQARRWRYAAEG